MFVSVIIAAAGSGKRMGVDKNKQFLKLFGKEILVHTLERFQGLERINEIVIVGKASELKDIQSMVRKNDIKKVAAFAVGGSERSESIMNGLKAVDPRCTHVLIHDGARPFIEEKEIEKVIDELVVSDGVIVAVPVKDTIKVVKDDYVEETLDRRRLISVQTPQGFNYKRLLEAYESNSDRLGAFTDDSSIFEAYGCKVKVVAGKYDNIKITTPEDLIMGEMILKRQRY